MIETIHLSGVATYTLETPSLRDLKEVNYFYGANGSGKTTISRVIANPAHRDHSRCDLPPSAIPMIRQESWLKVTGSRCLLV